MLYGEKGYREKCYIGRNVTEGEMLQGETLQGELLQGEMSWGETLYIRQPLFVSRKFLERCATFSIPRGAKARSFRA